MKVLTVIGVEKYIYNYYQVISMVRVIEVGLAVSLLVHESLHTSRVHVKLLLAVQELCSDIYYQELIREGASNCVEGI